MKILVDKNIPKATVVELREQGYDVIDIRGTEDQGLKDKALWQKAIKEERLLITTDKGFAEHRGERHYGLLIIRLKQPARIKSHQRVLQTLKHYTVTEWPGLMVVMRDTFQSSWKSQSI
jgi:predicted nuclease of predicted toxin-antitoxin system